MHLTWHCGSYKLALSRPRIMGVLNVTPDSFSDGGSYAHAHIAIAHGMDMLDSGADIIDVGGESTRPGFEPVDPEEELRRVSPVVRELSRAGAIVSIDTRHPSVAQACIELGASVLNDVSGFVDPRMVDVAARSDVGCIVMHAGAITGKGAPTSARSLIVKGDRDISASIDIDTCTNTGTDTDANTDELASVMMGSSSSYSGGTLSNEDVVIAEILGFLDDRVDVLCRAGVDPSRICIDPGPGFGKQANEDVIIQRATEQMVARGYPLMCAVSRKRMVGALSGAALNRRDPATCGISLAAAEKGAHILRVHNVADMAYALDGYWSIMHPQPRRAFVALGSNVGESMNYLVRAIQALNAIPLTTVSAVSHAYETEPAYGLETPVVNCVVEISTELTPLVLLDNLLGIEQELGRTRTPGSKVCEPRTVDCDLLWMESEIHAGNKLKLPHPEIGERHFVLEPLRDLVSNLEQFLSEQGIVLTPVHNRYGAVRANLGEIAWQ